jgi:hypothetical protein
MQNPQFLAKAMKIYVHDWEAFCKLFIKNTQLAMIQAIFKQKK